MVSLFKESSKTYLETEGNSATNSHELQVAETGHAYVEGECSETDRRSDVEILVVSRPELLAIF